MTSRQIDVGSMPCAASRVAEHCQQHTSRTGNQVQHRCIANELELLWHANAYAQHSNSSHFSNLPL